MTPYKHKSRTNRIFRPTCSALILLPINQFF
nr:MAG TPA: hypothetical protein [Caudoviricetes sp.]